MSIEFEPMHSRSQLNSAQAASDTITEGDMNEDIKEGKTPSDPIITAGDQEREKQSGGIARFGQVEGQSRWVSRRTVPELCQEPGESEPSGAGEGAGPGISRWRLGAMSSIPGTMRPLEQVGFR